MDAQDVLNDVLPLLGVLIGAGCTFWIQRTDRAEARRLERLDSQRETVADVLRTGYRWTRAASGLALAGSIAPDLTEFANSQLTADYGSVLIEFEHSVRIGRLVLRDELITAGLSRVEHLLTVEIQTQLGEAMYGKQRREGALKAVAITDAVERLLKEMEDRAIAILVDDLAPGRRFKPRQGR